MARLPTCSLVAGAATRARHGLAAIVQRLAFAQHLSAPVALPLGVGLIALAQQVLRLRVAVLAYS